MIQFLLTRGHDYTLKKVKKSPLAPSLGLMNYDRLFRSRWIKHATQVFADLDRLSYWDLELAADLYLQMKNAGLPVWNNPARFKNRHSLLRALHTAGLNDFDAYRVHEINSIKRFPVFLRKIQGHRAPLSGLLETRAETEKAIDAEVSAGTPEENLVLIELAAEPIRAGLYRKLAAFRIGNAIVPHLSVHDTVWLVKYGRTFDAIEDLYQEEHAMLEQNPFAEHLRKVFDVAGVEYGRADFGFFQGRIQVFEINTNPHVAPAEPHPSATRVASMNLAWKKYMQALRAIDSHGGRMVRLADGQLQRRRPWKNLLVRTRKVH
ncbi:MAG: hypothetical protein ABSC01_06120 [Verrucomicrobiota bacterium]